MPAVMAEQLRSVEQAFWAATALQSARGDAALTDTRLDEICGHDPTLRAEVQSLLDHARELGVEAEDHSTFLSPRELHGSRSGAAVLTRAAALQEWGGAAIGQRIGDFVLIGELGAGGMGVVYVAEQQRPRRTVALKVIRRTIATALMIARFEREAELLGRLSHPGIAQIYAAGIADVIIERGATLRVPYIAMELVNGLHVLDHVRAHHCTPQQIFTLMAQACDAIQHAHQRGVIHRDLKPANLLVAAADAEHRVKVLDFGVARAVEADGDLTQLTGHGHFIGTPAYVSPEQLHGHGADVDTRCDVYALGVILYQLLAGRHPIDLEGCSLPEAARRIIDHHPPRLGTIDRRFRGPIETIVAKAMEKRPGSRYTTPADLARDLRHWLANEPIEAARPSPARAMGNWAACHRTTLLLTVCALALLAALTIYKVSHHARDPRINKLEAELLASRLERARLLRLEGDLAAAEDLIWRDYLDQPASAPIQLALAQLYVRPAEVTTTRHAQPTARMLRPDGWIAAQATERGSVNLSSTAGASEVPTQLTSITSLQFNADASNLLVIAPDGLALIDVHAARLLRAYDCQGIHVNAADLSRDGRYVVSTQSDGSVRLWQAATGELLLKFAASPVPGRCIRFNRAATHVAAAFDDGAIHVWPLDSLTNDRHPREPVKFPSPGSTLAFSPDGSILATAAPGGPLHLWRTSDGSSLATLP